MSKENKDQSENGWWFDRYDYDYRDYSYSRESGSRGWMSKLGGYDDYDYSRWYGSRKDDPKWVFQNLLNQLQNSANIIGDNNVGVIKVKWSNGMDRNSASDKVVFLSPDNLTNKDGEIEEETVDAMTGKVYLASAMRDTVDDESYIAAQVAREKSETSHVHRGAVKIWEAIETSIARHKVIEDWMGFAPYICKDSERSSASKDSIQKFIDDSSEQPNIDAAVLAISWNLLNPNDRIRIPDCYDSCIDAAAEALGKEINPKDRFRASFSLSSKIASLLPKPPEPKKEDREEENGDGGGDDCNCADCRNERKKQKEKSAKSDNKSCPKSVGQFPSW